MVAPLLCFERSGSLIFYASIKRDVSGLIPELHLHMPRSDLRAQRLARLLQRWLDVADYTSVSELSATGSVGEVLATMRLNREGVRGKP